jgi:hypothetical protein
MSSAMHYATYSTVRHIGAYSVILRLALRVPNHTEQMRVRGHMHIIYPYSTYGICGGANTCIYHVLPAIYIYICTMGHVHVHVLH